MELIIYFRHKKTKKPVIKVIDIKKQVVLAFVSLNGEHLTLHPQKDGSILRTYYSKNKPKSTWDDMRVETARAMGYKDPTKHGKYYIHEPLFKVSNMAGYHLVGRRIDISKAPEDKEKYKKIKKIVIDTPQESCMITLYLSTNDNPYTPETNPNFSTSLGKIFIDFEK